MRITIYILFMFVHLFAVAQDTIVAPSVGNGSDALTIQSIKLNAGKRKRQPGPQG